MGSHGFTGVNVKEQELERAVSHQEKPEQSSNRDSMMVLVLMGFQGVVGNSFAYLREAGRTEK